MSDICRHRYELSESLSWVGGILRLMGSVDQGIDLDDISGILHLFLHHLLVPTEIRPGYQAYLFNIQDPPPHPREEALAVSIIGSEGTLSMLLTSPQERELFLSHFQGFIKMIRPTVSVY